MAADVDHHARWQHGLLYGPRAAPTGAGANVDERAPGSVPFLAEFLVRKCGDAVKGQLVEVLVRGQELQD